MRISTLRYKIKISERISSHNMAWQALAYLFCQNYHTIVQNSPSRNGENGECGEYGEDTIEMKKGVQLLDSLNKFALDRT